MMNKARLQQFQCQLIWLRRRAKARTVRARSVRAGVPPILDSTRSAGEHLDR
jgi:hypothetical protein